MGFYDSYSDEGQPAKQDDSFWSRLKGAIGVKPEGTAAPAPTQGRQLAPTPSHEQGAPQPQPAPAPQPQPTNGTGPTNGTKPEPGPLTKAAAAIKPRMISTMSPEPRQPQPSYRELGIEGEPPTQAEQLKQSKVTTADALHGMATETKGAVETPMKAAIVGGLATNPIATGTALLTFMGLDEAKNAVVSVIKKEPYKFQGGKGIADLLGAEGLSKDAIELGEFIVEGMGAGGVTSKGRGIFGDIVSSIKGKKEKVAFVNEAVADAKTQNISPDEAAYNKRLAEMRGAEEKRTKGREESAAAGKKAAEPKPVEVEKKAHSETEAAKGPDTSAPITAERQAIEDRERLNRLQNTPKHLWAPGDRAFYDNMLGGESKIELAPSHRARGEATAETTPEPKPEGRQLTPYDELMRQEDAKRKAATEPEKRKALAEEVKDTLIEQAESPKPTPKKKAAQAKAQKKGKAEEKPSSMGGPLKDFYKDYADKDSSPEKPTGESAGPHTAPPPASSGEELTYKKLNQQVIDYKGTGGIASEAKQAGFAPAFKDNETGKIYESLNDKGKPSGVHNLDGLPDEVISKRNEHGEVSAVKGSIEAGFTKDGKYFTRDEAAAVKEPLRPAVKTSEGEVVEGEPGSTHPETMKDEGIKPDADHERGFTRGDGDFQSRAKAKKDLKENEPEVYAKWEKVIRDKGRNPETEELHSEDLNAAKEVVGGTKAKEPWETTSPIRENGARTSIVLDDGTALVGGKIHGETYNMALEMGIPEDSLSKAKSGFTKPDGTTWNLQGKKIPTTKVRNVDPNAPEPKGTKKAKPKSFQTHVQQSGGIDQDKWTGAGYSLEDLPLGLRKKGGRAPDELGTEMVGQNTIPAPGDGVTHGDHFAEQVRKFKNKMPVTIEQLDKAGDGAILQWEKEHANEGNAARRREIEEGIKAEVFGRSPEERLQLASEDPDFPREEVSPEAPSELFDTSKQFTLSGNQPAKASTMKTAEPKGERLLDVEKQDVDQLHDRLKKNPSLLDDQSGQIAIDLLTPGLQTGMKVAEGGKKIFKAAETLVLPTDKSPEHLAAGEVLGAKLGSMHRDAEVAAADLKKDGKYFIKQGVHDPKTPLDQNAGVKFMSDMSQGRVLTGRLAEIGKKIERLFNDRLKKLEEAGAALKDIRDNYFPGMWTQESHRAFNAAVREITEADPGLKGKDLVDWTASEKKQVRDRVKELVKGGEGSDKDALSYITKKPFKGKESFRKQKAFDDIMDGVDFGLEPISNNPIDLVMLKLAEMDRSIMANRALKEWKEKGDVKFLSTDRTRPQGWQEVKDKYGTVYGPPEMMTSEYVSQTQYDALDQTLTNLGIKHDRKPGLGHGNALGLSHTGKSKIETKANTELSVMAHEIGHQLDDKYNLWDRIVKQAEGVGKKGDVTKTASAKKRSEIQEELRAIADLRWEGQQPTEGFKKYTRKQTEKIAQMVEAYVQVPERFMDVAPNVHAAFDKFLKSIPELKPLEDIQGGISYKELTTKRDVGGFPVIGHWIAKDGVSDVLNNYLSSSLYNSPYFGTAYKGWMSSANMLNQFQLGVGSAFHAGFTSMDVQISAGANVIKDSYGLLRGNRSVGDLGKSVGKFTTAMISNPKQGGKILNEWRTPSMEIPADVPLNQLPSDKKARIGMVAKAAELAGGAFKLETGMRMELTDTMLKNWHSGAKGKAKAIAEAPFGFVELTAKPIMNWLVPRQKAGVFGDLAGRIIDMNPGKTMAELTPQFRQAWNRVDARLGQVVYDRLFMNNVTKNVIQAMVRAPGWTGGTIAELGGAPKDFAGFFKEWAKTGKMPENIPDRVAYTAALLTLTTVTNGLLTYAFTGDKPQGIDYWAFRTGGKDEYGKDERFVLPSYAKDLFSYYEDAGHTILAKTHPLIGLMGDLYKNRDYYGVKVRNEDDPIWQQAVDMSTYTAKQFVPFWMRGTAKETQRGGGFMETLKTSPQKILAPVGGVMPATSAYTMTPFEKKARQIQKDERPLGTRTKEEGEKAAMKRTIQMKLRKEDPTAEDDLNDAIDNGTLTRKEANDLHKSAAQDPLERLGKSLSMDQLARALPSASEEEKETLMPIFRKRYYSKEGKGSLSKKEQERYEKLMEED